MNSTLLQGTIASQPELNFTQDGAKKYTRFSISFPGPKPEDPAETMNAVAWGALAEAIATYSSGLEVVLEGRIEIQKGQKQGDSYPDPLVRLVANRCHALGATTPMPAKQPAQPQAAPAAAKAKAPAAQAKTPVTPVAAMASAGKAEVANEMDYDSIPF